jgi:DNA-binding transcriptional LysR family regulator
MVQANSARLLCSLAAQGRGYTVLPYSAIDGTLRAGQLTAAPVAGLSVTWTLIAVRDRSQTLAGRKLRETISELVRARIADGTWSSAVALDRA